MRSFMSPPSPMAGATAVPARSGRAFWHKQSGAVRMFVPADAEAAQRSLLCRSEAFAEDLGPGYDGLRFVAKAPAAR